MQNKLPSTGRISRPVKSKARSSLASEIRPPGYAISRISRPSHRAPPAKGSGCESKTYALNTLPVRCVARNVGITTRSEALGDAAIEVQLTDAPLITLSISYKGAK
jgi:hypothetical protein